MIQVTPKAIDKIRKTFAKEGVTGGLRLGVLGGGCSGLSYQFKFDTRQRPTDKVFEFDGVKGTDFGLALTAPVHERAFGNAELGGDASEGQALSAQFDELIFGFGGVHGGSGLMDYWMDEELAACVYGIHEETQFEPGIYETGSMAARNGPL